MPKFFPHMPRKKAAVLDAFNKALENNLSTKTIQVLVLRSQRMPIKEISRILKISPKTIREHIVRHAPHLRTSGATTKLPPGGSHWRKVKRQRIKKMKPKSYWTRC